MPNSFPRKSLSFPPFFPIRGTTESQVWEIERTAKDAPILVSGSKIAGYVRMRALARNKQCTAA